MDIHSLIKTAGLVSIYLSSAFSFYALADVNADTNSEDRFWINRGHQNLNKVDHFNAVSEQILAGQAEPIISHIAFQKPDNFYQQVVQPQSLKGLEASYRNNTLTLHNHPHKHALIIKGLAPFKERSAHSRVKGIYLFNKEHYEQVFTPSIHVADRLAVGIDLTAKEDTSTIRKIEGFADYHYSLFMQATFIFSSGLDVKTHYKSIEFNAENFTLPDINLAKETSITSWDFNHKALTKTQREKQISQDIIWPDDADNTWDFDEHKYFQKGDEKTAAAYFYSDDFFLITVAEAQQKPGTKQLNTMGAPLVIENTPVLLNQFPTFSTIELNHLGIHYRLLSNIHPESLISMVKGIIKE
tara:strand:+ start:3749 stop:4816 length:1068 start_codon:yes stop_codon:yes gene_type:complete